MKMKRTDITPILPGILLIALSSVFIVYIAFIARSTSETDSIDQQLISMSKYAEANSIIVSGFMEQHVEQFLLISTDEKFRQSIFFDHSPLISTDALASLFKINTDDVGAISAISKKGVVLDTHPPNAGRIGQNFWEESGFQHCRTTHTPHISKVSILGNGKFGIYISVPVLDGQEFIGVLQWSVESSSFLDMVMSPALLDHQATKTEIKDSESKQQSWLMDYSGWVIAHPVRYHVGENYLGIHERKYPHLEWSELDLLMQQINNKKGSFGFISYHDTSIPPDPSSMTHQHKELVVYRLFEVYNDTWVSVVNINYDAIASAIDSESKRIYISAISLILLLVIYAFSLYFGQRRKLRYDAKIDNLELLAATNERFHELARLLPQSVFEADNSGYFTYANQHGLDTLGYTTEDIDNGLNMFDVIIESDRSKAQENFSQTMSGGMPKTREYQLLAKNGDTFPVLLSTNHIYDGEKIVGIRGIAINVKRMKKVESELTLKSQISEVFNVAVGDEVYAEVLAILLETFSSGHGSFGYINDQGDLVVPSLTEDIFDKEGNAVEIPVFSTKGDTIFGRSIRNKQGEYVNHPFKTPPGHVQIEKAINVPINYNGKIIGNIMLANKVDDYTDADLEMLEGVAEQVAPILNSKLALETNIESLEYLATDLSSLFGKKLFKKSVLKLCAHFRMDIVFLGEVEDGERIQNVAVAEGDTLVKNFVYDLKGTPCSELLNSGACSYPSGVTEQFPEDKGLKEKNIEGYVGVPLYDSHHQAMGVLVALSKTTIENPSNIESILQLYSVRLAAEVERDKVDKQLKATSGELELERNRSDAILESTNAGTWVWEVQTDALEINERWAEIIGYTRKELEPIDINTWRRLTHPEDLASAEQVIDKIFNKEINYYDFDVRQSHKDGKWVWVNARGNVTKWSKKGEPLLMTGTHLDITKQKVAEQERLIIDGQLHQSQKLEAMGTMVGGISHELNNVLQSMFLYSGIIKDKLPNDEALISDFQHLFRDGERARDIVKQILTFSRNASVDQSPRDLGEIVSDALTFQRASLPANINIEQNINDTGSLILCDKTQVHQIVINLCNNAEYAMRESGGTLTVNMDRIQSPSSGNDSIGEIVKLEICDTGHGMDGESMERIFDPFFTTKEVGEGTGLGLSVVHGIVESMQGSIAVDSELGKGTTFRLNFPVIGIAEEKPARSTVDTSESDSAISVLLVDDEESIREVTRMILSKKGFHVDSASDGEEALSQYSSNPQKYDLIITDLSMPNLSGPDLAKEIRIQDTEVPIILSTGELGIEDKNEYRDIGITSFIQKPWSIEEMIKLIEEIAG